MSSEQAVQERYSAGALEREAALCCPVSYDRRFLEKLPAEIIERDYGCGDPSQYVQPGEVVLDLGSGGGKICYIAAQVVGPTGRVIGVDCNAEMLALARKHQEPMAESLGYANVDFRCGLIQDLQLDLELLQRELGARPVRDWTDWLWLRQTEDRLRKQSPLVAADSIDCVVSNCVLNLVRPEDRRQLFREIVRVLRPGGRMVVSDIVSDQPVPQQLQDDPELWSGCISGAFQEAEFLAVCRQAGLEDVEILSRQREPWQTVGGIEFRSLTLRAYKPLPISGEGETVEVIYRGPAQQLVLGDGLAFTSGVRTAVPTHLAHRLNRPAYHGQFEFLDSNVSNFGALPQTSHDNCCDNTGGCC